MQLGVCADPDSARAFAEAGFDFLEIHVQNHLRPSESDQRWQPESDRLRLAHPPCRAANCFLPASLKVTGRDVNLDALTAYAETVFRRAQTVGVQVVVFGSGGARRIPDGFPREEAWEQLVAFGRRLGSLAERWGVTLAVEPLNRQETNVLTSVSDGARYVRQVDLPSVRLLVDAHHWGREQESLEDLEAAAPLLVHVHVGTVVNRLAPGLEPCDFTGFFSVLRRSGYRGGVSVEARWNDPEREASRVRALLREWTGG